MSKIELDPYKYIKKENSVQSLNDLKEVVEDKICEMVRWRIIIDHDDYKLSINELLDLQSRIISDMGDVDWQYSSEAFMCGNVDIKKYESDKLEQRKKQYARLTVKIDKRLKDLD